MSEDLFTDAGPEAEENTGMWEDPYAGLDFHPTEPPSDNQPIEAEQDDNLEEHIIETMRLCLAALSGRRSAEGLDMLGYILSSTAVLDSLGKNDVRRIKRLCDVLASAWGDDHASNIDYDDVPDIAAAGGAVNYEFSIITSYLTREDLPKNPAGTWRALQGKVQRVATRGQAIALATACEKDAPDEELMFTFRQITPPSVKTEVRNADFSMTAAQWEDAYRVARSRGTEYRVSSGYPTLDYALTAKDPSGSDAEAFGAFAPGELHVFAGATGNGKSAWARPLARNMAYDLVNGWGLSNAQILYAFTEETADIVLRTAGLAEGMPFHHLAKNITLANVGPSRKRLVHAVWDLVIKAYHRSQELGIPITSCELPYVIFWDYIGGTAESGEPVDTVASQINADLAMRGFAQWDPYAMETFSKESFSAYSGMPWPDGMEFFRPVVIAFAQFRKLADPVWYDPTNKACNLADFTVENADGSPGWEVRTGDFRVPTQAEIRGSGILANHATAIYTLHRSRPQKNPKVLDPVLGRYRLVDDRARIIPTKVRNSSDLTFVPMRFDSQPSGLRGQFYDVLAARAINSGQLSPSDPYREDGDPILPPRTIRTAFDGVSY
jgi:hypothetical protein